MDTLPKLPEDLDVWMYQTAAGSVHYAFFNKESGMWTCTACLKEIKEKELLTEEISELIKCEPDLLSAEALAYFEVLKTEPTKKSVEITENGAKILKFMQENWEKHNNIFKATTIAEGLFTNGKSVSGSMRKLVSDGS